MRISSFLGAHIALALLAGPALAQPMPTDNDVVVNLTPADIENLTAKSQTNERQVVNAELKLTPAEAQAFWPVYNAYSTERAPIYAKRQDLINQFVAISSSIGDAQAAMFANQWVQLDADEVNLRLKYLPKFDAALSGHQARQLPADRPPHRHDERHGQRQPAADPHRSGW